MQRSICIMFLLVAVSLIFLPTNASALPILYAANGHYYEAIAAIPNTRKWTEAVVAAQTLHYLGYTGHLATITSAAENTFVVTTFNDPTDGIPPVEYWLGGTDQVTEGTWTWVTGEPWGYTNWNSGEPTGDDYLVYWTGDGKWNDWGDNGEGSNKAEGYIVEYDVPPIPEPASMLLLGTGLLGLVGLRRRR